MKTKEMLWLNDSNFASGKIDYEEWLITKKEIESEFKSTIN